MELRTKSQRIWDDVRTCLNIMGGLESYLRPHSHSWVVDPAAPNALDHEVKTSAEATFINTCNRLDILLDRMTDSSRADEKVERAVLRNIAAASSAAHAEADAERARKHALRSASRPSVLFQPKIFRHTSKMHWVAYYGDLSAPEHCVIGVGLTLEAAMLDFDREFVAKQEEEARQAEQQQKPKAQRGKK